MTTKKATCWEFKQCGLEPGGRNVSRRGVCPVALEQRADGIHGGRNAGRCCWVVTGSLCDGKTQGNYTEKMEYCRQCSFYKTVRQEEHPAFKVVTGILKEMQARHSGTTFRNNVSPAPAPA